ncbi:hypothetical protein [Agromyces sp. Marseille-Q5079]|uniref:hypothetical protein n=1 Tax=Agromyces sp. Marseille-Q5079 TaxID=3439059 RepID=UPI003D9C9952
MSELAGAAAEPRDAEFTVAQDTEFDEVESVIDDEHRPLDDDLADEVPGIDAERRADLGDERDPRAGTGGSDAAASAAAASAT